MWDFCFFFVILVIYIGEKWKEKKSNRNFFLVENNFFVEEVMNGFMLLLDFLNNIIF